MLANLTLADLQIQIGATLIVIVVVAAVSFVLGRLSMIEVVLTEEQQAEVDRMEATIRDDAESRKAQMTPFRGPLGPAIDDQPSTSDELYTEHSPQIPELRKPSGVYEDDWRGGEYGGSVEMLRRNVKEIED